MAGEQRVAGLRRQGAQPGITDLGHDKYQRRLIRLRLNGTDVAETLIAEGLEEVRTRGGGYLLFAGCAAGDTAAAMVLRVG